MLVELRAENYAVIDHAIAVFGPGLNLLTGETGAGKSILVDALALLMGGKASVEVVRHGAEKAVVACVFEATRGAEAILEENGIDAEGNEIILRREILSSGKGRVFVNNQPATVAVLKQLAPELALVHAQSETAEQLRPGAAADSARPFWRVIHRGRGRGLCSLARGFRPNSTICCRASRTGCAWWTCGATRARRSSRRI